MSNGSINELKPNYYRFYNRNAAKRKPTNVLHGQSMRCVNVSDQACKGPNNFTTQWANMLKECIADCLHDYLLH